MCNYNYSMGELRAVCSVKALGNYKIRGKQVLWRYSCSSLIIYSVIYLLKRRIFILWLQPGSIQQHKESERHCHVAMLPLEKYWLTSVSFISELIKLSMLLGKHLIGSLHSFGNTAVHWGCLLRAILCDQIVFLWCKNVQIHLPNCLPSLTLYSRKLCLLKCILLCSLYLSTFLKKHCAQAGSGKIVTAEAGTFIYIIITYICDKLMTLIYSLSGDISKV